jgi:hypothetical protein
MLEDPIKRQEMVEFFRERVSPAMLAHPYRLIYDIGVLTDDDNLKEEVEIYSRGLADEIRKMRVFCLSTDPLSILMWSRYAENHHGICLEFDKHNVVIEKAQFVSSLLFQTGEIRLRSRLRLDFSLPVHRSRRMFRPAAQHGWTRCRRCSLNKPDRRIISCCCERPR